MRITVITPCWNASPWIHETVTSVREQSFLQSRRNSVQYIVVDGGSADSTLDDVRNAWGRDPVNATLQIISGPDRGMYDALVKGMSLATGDWCCYLNAGDYYSRHALNVVAELGEKFRLDWITGMRVTYSREGTLISAKIPWNYNRRMIRGGYYGIRGLGRFIQQESTFWRTNLHSVVDMEFLRGLRLAGDLYLWCRFSEAAELSVVSAHLGGFRFHGGHLSENIGSYEAESRTFLQKGYARGYALGFLHEIASWIPLPVRNRLPGHPQVLQWDRLSEQWEFR